MKAKTLFLATRPGFFTASIVCVLVGLVAGWYHSQQLDLLGSIAILAASVLMHAGADMMNDYDDHASGADEANHDYIGPFSGGSRMIQTGALAAREVRRTAIGLLAAGMGLLILLALRTGPLILLLAGIGLFTSLFYTGRPLCLASRGLGELVVGINFGPVLVAAGYYVQAGAFPPAALLTSLPMMLLVMAILLVNELPDYAGDRAAGKRTLIVRLGRRRAAIVYIAVVAASYLGIIAAVAAGQLPALALIALGTLPLAAAAAANVRRYYDRPAQMSPASVQTIVNHLLTGLLLAVATYAAGASFPLLPLLLGSGAALLFSLRTYRALDGMRRAFLLMRET
jgi:1,4-dihydroxy-2-naphthoate octaprenyltransferase